MAVFLTGHTASTSVGSVESLDKENLLPTGRSSAGLQKLRRVGGDDGVGVFEGKGPADEDGGTARPTRHSHGMPPPLVLVARRRRRRPSPCPAVKQESRKHDEERSRRRCGAQ
ncbi:hypothetical protein TRIUR3_21583 [Triticum urartu]|uniref:Uncharacterized protein n=1 Tax=Triticum urartu TaxID=4572 RepID=M8ADH2_TRIUA|nr:hypothetical protein TRIUR3_21583 [Triticum urartu]